MPHLSQAVTPAEIDAVRALMREYETDIGIDLCFQNFSAELAALPGTYAPPRGRLLIATHDGAPVGCVALQPLESARCEMKRLYVRPGTRGLGVGRALVVAILDAARFIGYDEIVLDTLPTLSSALHLYAQFGFRDIDAYRPNPIAGVRYLGRSLADWDSGAYRLST